MAKQMSTTIQNALQQEEISTRMLLEVRLRVADIPTATLGLVSTQFTSEEGYLVFRFVANDTQDLTIPATCTDASFRNKLYVSAEIDRDNIDTSTDGQIEKTVIKISNKWQGWAGIFANLGNVMNNRPCRLLEYFPDFPTEPPIVIFDGVVNSVRMTAAQFEWELKRSVVDFNAESPNMTYDPMCQWKFKDERCKYAGTFLKRCDKTLQTCSYIGNVLNYGGHPSVPREMVIRSR